MERMEKVDEFQRLLTVQFRELVLAIAYLQIGQQSILRMPAEASISLTLAEGLTTEPMSLHELQPHSGSVGLGIAELFQTKVIAAWADLLGALFEFFVQAHLDGRKPFPALKKRTTKVGFSDSVDLVEQVRQGLAADFAFGKYADRIKVISDVLTPSTRGASALSVIRKHVFIRNSTQHHGGRVYAEMLQQLSTRSLNVLDHSGRTLSLREDEAIHLYVPELDCLKSSLFLITNEWREQLATYSNGSNP
jgi:hypothetical protein